MQGGIDPLLLGEQYVEALAWDYRTYGDPTADESAESHKSVTSRMQRELAKLKE